MARIITAGNETGDWAGDGFTVYAGSPGTGANQKFRNPSPGNNGGRYSISLTQNQGLIYDVTPQVPGGINEFYVRLSMNMGGRTDGRWERLRFLSPTGEVIFRFCTDGATDPDSAGGTWYPQIRDSSNSVLDSNSTVEIRNIDWAMVEIHAKLSTGTDGELDVWIGSELVIQYRGPLASGSLETTMGYLAPYYARVSGGSATSTYYDDIALNDTTGTVNNGRIGAGYVLPFWPAGEGTTSQLTNIFDTSTDNFKFVNKPVADNPSGFVGTSTPDDKDTYTLQPVPDEFWGINAVRVTAYGVRSGPTITKVKMLLVPPAQAEIALPSGAGMGVDLPIGAADYFWQDFNDNPNTSGEPFSKAEMDGMEAGIQFIA